MLPTRDPPQNKTYTQTESEGMEKIFQANRHEKKKASVAILISDKRFQNKGHKRRQRRTLHNT